MRKPIYTCKECKYYPKCVEMQVFGMWDEEDACYNWEPKEKENNNE